MGDKAATSLRARLAEAETREARRHIDPLLRELDSAAQQIRTSAREAERAALAARRSSWERPLTMFALGALITACALALVPETWTQDAAARRHQMLGQRLEMAWETLGEEQRKELRLLLGLAREAR